MLFLTTASFVIFLLLDVRFPLILAFIIGLFDLVPGIGATLGISLVCFIVLSQNVWLALKVLAACIVLQQIQDNYIHPRLMQIPLTSSGSGVFCTVSRRESSRTFRHISRYSASGSDS
jgi:predicted PurR-regulated permease PerM